MQHRTKAALLTLAVLFTLYACAATEWVFPTLCIVGALAAVYAGCSAIVRHWERR